MSDMADRKDRTAPTRRTARGGTVHQMRRAVSLVGLMGSGKSSVGHRLAGLLGVAFVDADDEIEKAANRSIAEIFAQYGEAEFRRLERSVLGRLAAARPRVIATGGGAFMDPETRAILSERTTTVWLRAELDVLVKRTAGRTHRPLLNNGDPRAILSNLMEQRYPVYAEAQVTVESEDGMTHEQMARRIIAAMGRHDRDDARNQT